MPEPVRVSDCCVTVLFDAEAVLVVNEGETDPFTGETIVWPVPRTYWSNGVVSDGYASVPDA